MYDYIVAFDPSGSFNEGKGTTGWCVFSAKQRKVINAGHISASTFDTAEEYWKEHIKIIDKFQRHYGKAMCVVLEDYRLYGHKAESQINSRMETCKLIGIMQFHLAMNKIRFKFQLAAEVKTRWSDDILLHKKYIEKRGNRFYCGKIHINKHTKDAVRHAVHYATFKNKGE